MDEAGAKGTPEPKKKGPARGTARQTKAVKQLRAAARIALTGTPVENRLSDLWSLFDFLCPGLLGSPAGLRRLTAALPAELAGRACPDAPVDRLRLLTDLISIEVKGWDDRQQKGGSPGALDDEQQKASEEEVFKTSSR